MMMATSCKSRLQSSVPWRSCALTLSLDVQRSTTGYYHLQKIKGALSLIDCSQMCGKFLQNVDNIFEKCSKNAFVMSLLSKSLKL